MEKLTLSPISHLEGEITLPGSKSLSNRILLLAALSKGSTRISNLLKSDDVDRMLEALNSLGINCYADGSDWVVEGGCFQAPSNELFLGNAGTAMRPLAATLCFCEGEFQLVGEPRMYERPIRDLMDSMAQLGANFEYLESEGYPPLKIQGKNLEAKTIQVKGNTSSQFLTALLMSAPLADGEMVIEVDGELVSKPYIKITLDVMQKFGIQVENQSYERFVIPAGQQYTSPGSIFVEGDASAASYFLAAGAIAGGKVRVIGAGSNSVQGDTQFLQVVEAMGAKVKVGDNWMEVEGTDSLKGVDLDLNHIPDAAMTLGTLALFAKGPSAIRNVANWRVKETDRLAAMATELRKVGAEVVEGDDFIEIIPPQTWKHAEIATYDDHRMAMCFSLVALGPVPVTILDPGCTSKTFPEYFDSFKTLVQE